MTLSKIVEKAEHQTGMDALVGIPIYESSTNQIAPALAEIILNHLFERGYRIVRHVSVPRKPFAFREDDNVA
jgi:hypothetical protein